MSAGTGPPGRSTHAHCAGCGALAERGPDGYPPAAWWRLQTVEHRERGPGQLMPALLCGQDCVAVHALRACGLTESQARDLVAAVIERAG